MRFAKIFNYEMGRQVLIEKVNGNTAIRIVTMNSKGLKIGVKIDEIEPDEIDVRFEQLKKEQMLSIIKRISGNQAFE